MSELEFHDVVDDGIGPLTLRFSAGLSCCFGDSLAALGRLVELGSGSRSPRRGHVLCEGVAVRHSPKARGKIVSLLPEEELPFADRVDASLTIALKLRGSELGATQVLEKWGLESYAGARPSRLAPDERRAIRLAVCLCETNSSFVLLHDPLSLVPIVPRSRVIERCIELSKERTVVVTTESLLDAGAFGGNAYLLERGRLSSHVGLGLQRGEVSLRVRTREAQRLAEALRTDARLHVRYDPHSSKAELSVSGQSLALVATVLASIATEQRIGIEGLFAELPSLAPLLDARAAQLSRPATGRARFSFGNKSA